MIFYCSREKSYCISHSLAPNQLFKTLYQPSHDIILKTLQNSNMLSHAHNSTNLVSSSLFKSFILTMFLLGLLIFYSDVSFNFGYSNLLRKDTSIFMIISLFGPMPYSHRTSTAEHHKWSSNDLFFNLIFINIAFSIYFFFLPLFSLPLVATQPFPFPNK